MSYLYLAKSNFNSAIYDWKKNSVNAQGEQRFTKRIVLSSSYWIRVYVKLIYNFCIHFIFSSWIEKRQRTPVVVYNPQTTTWPLNGLYNPNVWPSQHENGLSYPNVWTSQPENGLSNPAFGQMQQHQHNIQLLQTVKAWDKNEK